uniref:Uncharacterized protein n=1 Tax=Anopheles atroparvus TaxID=41427 RepID=A0A182IQZ7_ANOAO
MPTPMPTPTPISKRPLRPILLQIKGKFEKYLEHQAVTARHFDCVSIAQLGFVAVVNYHDQELNMFDEGSPVFQIQEDGTTEIVQTFGQSNQHTVHLWVHGKHVYLTHTYANLDASRQNVCPLYRWSGYYFDIVDHMPCYNAVQIEAFSIEQQMFVAVARQMTAGGAKKDSFSDIFLLNPDTQKLVLHQQIYTYSVSDIAYFFIEERDRRQHFLITGNSLAASAGADGEERGGRTSRDSDQKSIVYKFVDGFFVPFQNVELNGVKMFLPVVHENGEFLLLVLCHDQPLLIYEYDGWKLVPSRIDYTGEAFAAGVAHMRVYRHIVNASVIVIANSNLFGKSVNLFTPQYGIENDLRQVYAHFIEWCERMNEQTSQVNLEELYNRLAELPDNAVDGVRSIDKNVELQDSVVGTVKAKAVKTKDILIDDAQLSYVVEVNEYVQRVNAKMDLVEQTIHASVLTNGTVHWNGDLEVSELIAPAGQMKQLDVKVLNNGAHKTRHADASTEPTDDDGFTVVDRLIVDRFVDVRFWNGHAAQSLLLIDDGPTKWKDLTVSAERVVVGGNLYVNKLIDGVFFHPGNVLLPGVDQVFSGHQLVVKDLNVNRLTSKRLNSTDAGAVRRMMDQSRTLLAKSRGAMPQAYGNDFDTIDVDDLKLTGLLNEMDPRYLVENVLLHDAEHQDLGGKLAVEQITADHVVFVESKLSGVEWDNIARTTGAQQILQDLQFVQPIVADSLVLRDRLNHIPVIDGKLQVLLLDSNETQSITGTKTFDYVTLLKPIELQGKIDGEALSRMNPIVTTVEDLVLDGNYTILGNVTFNGPLWAHNILTTRGTHDLHRLATHGLRLDGAPGPDQVIRFLQPVFVEHLGASKINELDVNDLVPQAASEVQYLTGRKTFIGDLVIDGVADANEVNKVDLNQLNRTIFRRGADGVEQTIEGTIHFDTVITPVVNANRVLFEGKRMDRLLRLDVPQNVSAPVRFENCTIYVEGAVVAQELHTDNSSLVFGYDMDHLFKDTLRLEADASTAPVVVGPKSFRNLTVGQLVLLDGAAMNSIPVENIKHILVSRENRTIFKQGAYPFQSEITVNHLQFDGSINGIPKESFCRAWLMRTGDQTFSVGQTFETVMAEHLDVTGTLNGGVRMDQLLENVYRTDREEYIHQAIFHEGIVSYEPCTVGGLVSGLNLSSDVLLKQSPEIQTLGTVQVSQTLRAKGELHILNHLNGIHFPKMMEFFAPSDDVARAEPNIEVHGNVYFEHDPTIIHLNGQNIQKLYGDFNIKTLNGHNIETDYLRADVSVNNFTAIKRFRELHVETIICPPPCVIQEVDMDEWYKNGLRLKGNQTIEGTLHIVDGVITGNVEVLGTVNGIRFDPDHLLLKTTPQSINGSLSLITKFPKENKIFPMVFESLHAKMINGKDVARFLTNAARRDTNPLIINNPVSFVSPMEAEETVLEGDMLFGVNITDLILSTSYQAGVNVLASQVRSLNSVNEKLTENVFENSPVFSHFDKMKPMAVNALWLCMSLSPADHLQ